MQTLHGTDINILQVLTTTHKCFLSYPLISKYNYDVIFCYIIPHDEACNYASLGSLIAFP